MHRALKCALREVTELRPQLRSWEGLRDAGRASGGAGRPGGRGGAGPEAAVSAVGSSCVAVAGSRRGLGRTILSLGDLSTRSCDKVGGLLRTIVFLGGGAVGVEYFLIQTGEDLRGPRFAREQSGRLAEVCFKTLLSGSLSRLPDLGSLCLVNFKLLVHRSALCVDENSGVGLDWENLCGCGLVSSDACMCENSEKF